MDTLTFFKLWFYLSINIFILYFVFVKIYRWCENYFEKTICEYEFYERARNERFREIHRNINYREAIERIKKRYRKREK